MHRNHPNVRIFRHGGPLTQHNTRERAPPSRAAAIRNACERQRRRSLAARSRPLSRDNDPLTGQTIATDDTSTDAPEPDSHLQRTKLRQTPPRPNIGLTKTNPGLEPPTNHHPSSRWGWTGDGPLSRKLLYGTRVSPQLSVVGQKPEETRKPEAKLAHFLTTESRQPIAVLETIGIEPMTPCLQSRCSPS